MTRRPYIDWLRGVAVLCMIEWHVLDSWTHLEGRETFVWAIIGTIGGVAAPLFLFLAGLAVPLAGEARIGRGAPPRAAGWSLQKRGWQIFFFAHVFRFQSFLLNPNARWHAVLKPDILNILGLGLVLAAFCWGRARETGTARARALWLLGPSAIVLALTPFAKLWWWPTLLHPRLEAYIRPVDGYGVFTLFPAIAYVPVGAFLGALLVAPRSASEEPRLHARLALAGLAAIACGFALSAVPAWLPRVKFFTSAIDVFTWRNGTMFVMMWLAWIWARRFAPRPESALIVFGRTSLFVYWVHVELAYGVFSYPLQHALPLRWSLVGLALMIALMLQLARWWKDRPDRHARAAAYEAAARMRLHVPQG